MDVSKIVGDASPPWKKVGRRPPAYPRQCIPDYFVCLRWLRCVPWRLNCLIMFALLLLPISLSCKCDPWHRGRGG